ncbi:hypothetical protein AAWM_11204 [Aspergillus awamori]|uniref:O-methyltransferase dimerisation domain-containing protein n=1 Tax=Aspergillus awamori TaxID=105351 RepID=A0A401L9X2_ASPAW|nr:hypothetical protein AAWM_11204 [Aspergillus awamori]
MDLHRLQALETIDPKPLAPWREQTLAEIEIEPNQEKAKKNAAARRDMPGTSQRASGLLKTQSSATTTTEEDRGCVPQYFKHVANMGAIRALLEAGVFHAIPTGGKSISAREISVKTGVDKEVIVRLMRAVTPMGPFRETGEEEYAHTPFSEIYMHLR